MKKIACGFAMFTVACAVAGCGSTPTASKRAGGATAWTTSGQTVYSNEFNPSAGTKALPYILGGTCVAPPSEAALIRYQAAGYMRGMTVSQLEALYKAEKIAWTPQEVSGVPGEHVLEGGRSLFTPLPGSTGYARLFCKEAPTYKPMSPEVKALASTVEKQREAPQPGVAVAAMRPAVAAPVKTAPLASAQPKPMASSPATRPAAPAVSTVALPTTKPVAITPVVAAVKVAGRPAPAAVATTRPAAALMAPVGHVAPPQRTAAR